MNITGIITEYNPMHNGHLLHISETRKITNCDAIVCIMSGNFVQRGLPAVVDKWSRTQMALNNGVDLVIELPTIFSLSSAEFFAYGAVSTLNNLGVINNICFGSESGNIGLLTHIADTIVQEPEEYKIALKENLKKGFNFPRARSTALKDYFNKSDIFNEAELDLILNSSNNILGIEYIKSLIKLNSHIKPYTITRKGSLYNDLELTHKYSSATSIRKFIHEKGDFLNDLNSYMPENNVDILRTIKNNYNFAHENQMMPYLKYKSFTTPETLSQLPDIGEGLENPLITSLKECLFFNEVIAKVKSKRYTYTRINRILCQYFVGLEKYDLYDLIRKPAPYARVLGFNHKGREILSMIKKRGEIPTFTNINKKCNKIMEIDLQSTFAYSLLNKKISFDYDYKTPPIIL